MPTRRTSPTARHARLLALVLGLVAGACSPRPTGETTAQGSTSTSTTQGSDDPCTPTEAQCGAECCGPGDACDGACRPSAGESCVVSSECCTGSCKEGVCLKSSAGGSCAAASDCWGGPCEGFKCPCTAGDGYCNADADCCAGGCDLAINRCYDCGRDGSACADAETCCGRACLDGACRQCTEAGDACTRPDECCPGDTCIDGACRNCRQSPAVCISALDIHRAPRYWRADVVLEWIGDDAWRGWAIASVMRPHAAKLHPIVRGLLRRFGPDGHVADELAARVHSPGRAVASLAKHDEQQLENAGSWATDPDPEVRTFAERLLRSLKASHARYAAYEEHERRRWGT